jgi:hypothetical protein
LIHKGAERRGLYRLIQIRVVQNDQRRLSSQFQENWLEAPSRDLRNDTRPKKTGGDCFVLSPAIALMAVVRTENYILAMKSPFSDDAAPISSSN